MPFTFFFSFLFFLRNDPCFFNREYAYVRTRVVNSGNVNSVTMATARLDPTSFRPALPLAIPVLLCFFVSLARPELITIENCPPSSSIPFDDNNIAVKNASQDLRSNMVRNISDDGFLYASNSLGRSETKVYGLVLCRPDVAVDRGCRSCLQHAADLLYDCDKGLVWSDNCYMRSESYDFEGGARNENFIGVGIKNSAMDDVDPTPLFELVIEKAQRRKILYGVENTTVLSGTGSKYAMAQCTRDINDAQCGKCLNDLLLYSGKNCTGVQSCRLADYNCNLAYDSSPSFLDGK